MTTRLRPPGFGARVCRPHGLGSRARLRRGRSIGADAQRRFNAAAGEDEQLVQASAPTPNPSPPRAARAGGGERTSRVETVHPSRWHGRPPGEVELTLVTHEARALYEAGVVPVREIARLCGVSVRTLYHHVNSKGWKRRRASVPRDAAKSERQKRRYREQMALQAARPRGLKARDPAGQATALTAAKRAGTLAGPALAKAIARQDAESQARMMALRRARRRPYEWRPIGTPPAWADRRR